MTNNEAAYPYRRDANEEINNLYDENDYIEAYSRHTDIRVEQDPHAAVGSMWEEIGQLQIDFLVAKQMQSHHKMLDIGCGTLRGGRHFIKYLDTGNYSGFDISEKAIEYGKRLVQEEGLSAKDPNLIINENRNLRFAEFVGQNFDYLFAQSVFTHLLEEHIEECFAHIGKIMHDQSLFFFTFNDDVEIKRTTLKDFRYPFSFFLSLADENGFQIENCSKDFKHPRGQSMAVLSKFSPA